MDHTGPVRLLLVSRHTLIRAALVSLIAGQSDLSVVGEAGTRVQAQDLAGREVPDVILLNPHPDSDLWLDAIGPLTGSAGAQSRLLLLSDISDLEFQREALRLGARGFLDLDHPPATLFRAIQRVHAGEVWMERRLMAALLSANGGGADRERLETLTPREREIVRLVSEGLKNKQIAARLSVADVTVRHHLTSVFSKLDVPDRLSLVVFAFQHGLNHQSATWHNRS